MTITLLDNAYKSPRAKPTEPGVVIPSLTGVANDYTGLLVELVVEYFALEQSDFDFNRVIVLPAVAEKDYLLPMLPGLLRGGQERLIVLHLPKVMKCLPPEGGRRTSRNDHGFD